MVATVEGRMVVLVDSAVLVLVDAGTGFCTGVTTLILAPLFCNCMLTTLLISWNKAQHTSTLTMIAMKPPIRRTKANTIQATIPQHDPQHHLRYNLSTFRSRGRAGKASLPVVWSL